ncbi:MAG TPA: gliding motility lipoprotein GldH, partial [Bacteroidales bacterium]|nr:gliding motility lipoprotein GldH [Bacteroidales bacterium]
IRNTSDYGFCNLFIFLKTLYPDGNNSIDTIEFILAGPDGKWLGKGKNIIDNKILLKTNLSFPKAGNYSFEFTQAMRENKLKGIEDIGIQIEKIQ